MYSELSLNEKIKMTLDNGNILRGLLVLIGKDSNVWEHEAKMFLDAGVKLGYDKEFCQESIRNILRNDFVSQAPPKFHSRINALRFLRLGIRILNEKNNPHQKELTFLEDTAVINGITEYWERIKGKIKTSERVEVYF